LVHTARSGRLKRTEAVDSLLISISALCIAVQRDAKFGTPAETWISLIDGVAFQVRFVRDIIPNAPYSPLGPS
jgi:hypothetical protein